jgi:hypothetical protein
METLHLRLAELDAFLADPSAFLRADSPGHQALQDRDGVKTALHVLEEAWLELEEKRSGS